VKLSHGFIRNLTEFVNRLRFDEAPALSCVVRFSGTRCSILSSGILTVSSLQRFSAANIPDSVAEKESEKEERKSE